jgi:molecular chaperone HtpG
MLRMNNNDVKRLRLPSRLEGLLGGGAHSLEGHVRASIGDFETWLAHNHLIFFPEYTDHGVPHVDVYQDS